MDANPDRSLADVLEPVAGWLAAIPAQSRALGARFVTGCIAPRPVPPSLWVLPKFDLRLRLGLTVSEDRRILLFFHDQTGDVPVFKSETRFQIGPLAEAAANAGWKVFAINTFQDAEVADAFRAKIGAKYPFYRGDDKLLKTIIRSNPGVVIWKDGVVLDNYHWRHLPTPEALLEKFK